MTSKAKIPKLVRKTKAVPSLNVVDAYNQQQQDAMNARLVKQQLMNTRRWPWINENAEPAKVYKRGPAPTPFPTKVEPGLELVNGPISAMEWYLKNAIRQQNIKAVEEARKRHLGRHINGPGFNE